MKALFALTLLLGLNFAAYAGEGHCTKSADGAKKECSSEKKDCSEGKVCEKGAEKTEEAKN